MAVNPIRIAPTLPAPPRPAAKPRKARGYHAAQHNRLTSDWLASSTSFDAELRGSLRTLRNRSRQLVRDNDYAKNAMRVIRNNVVGTGFGLQGQVWKRGDKALHTKANASIEEEFLHWCKPGRCHTAGKLSFNEIQRVLMGAVPESGEVLVRLVPQFFGDSRVPLGIEIIESDQLADEYSGVSEFGNEVRMGVEMDKWQRPVAYWLYPRHPGDGSFIYSRTPDPNKLERIPASEVLHLFITERPNATRGVPWMHTAARALNDLNGTTEAEIVRTRAAACAMGFIETPDGEDPTGDGDGTGSPLDDGAFQGDRVTDFEPGSIRRLGPGEEYKDSPAAAPSPNLEQFINFLVRKAGVGIGLAYESASGDYSKVTYLSGRLSLINERDAWRTIQQWFVEHFLEPLFRKWLEMAVLAGVLLFADYELNPDKYSVRWLARGWDWVDPSKDVSGAKEGIKAGLSTRTLELAKKGQSAEDIDDERRRELDYQEGVEPDPDKPRKLVYDVDQVGGGSPSTAPPKAAPDDVTDPDDEIDEDSDGVSPAKQTQ